MFIGWLALISIFFFVLGRVRFFEVVDVVVGDRGFTCRVISRLSGVFLSIGYSGEVDRYVFG